MRQRVTSSNVFSILLLLLFVLQSSSFCYHSRRGIESRLTGKRSDDQEDGIGEGDSKQLISRFLEPKIDDPGLVLADAQISGIILPGVITIGNIAAGTRPSWLGYGNGILFPTVSHGSSLAICWLTGALAGQCYEKVAFSEYSATVSRTLQAGAFASGLLILGTQFRLATTGFAAPIDPNVIDANLVQQLRVAGELAVDIGVEAAGLLSWRLYRTYLTGVFGEDK